MTENRLLPIHPGEVLAEEFLTPMGLSQNKLAMDIHVSAGDQRDRSGQTPDHG